LALETRSGSSVELYGSPTWRIASARLVGILPVVGDFAGSVQSFLTNDVGSIAIRGGRIVLILLAAFIGARLLRRAARRLANRVAERQEARRAESEQGAELSVAQGCGGVRDRVSAVLPTFEGKERSGQRARTLGTILGNVGTIVVYAIAVMLCLSELGVNLAPILAGAGVVGIALGFGAQSIVRDFLSGIFIISEDQYGVGDVVDVGDAIGVVEEVTLRVTRVRGVDGTLWHVPNGQIKRSGNKSQYWARVLLDVPIAYDADIVAASTVIKQTADHAWHDREACDILEEPEVWGVEDFGSDSIAIRLAVKTLPGTQWAVARDLRARIKGALDTHGFEIPFPQRTVWVRERTGGNGTSRGRDEGDGGAHRRLVRPPGAEGSG
jgi:small-conductance mechanosensitive channel